MKIAQHFSAGIARQTNHQVRAADGSTPVFCWSSAVRFTDCDSGSRLLPPMNRCAIFMSSAQRTKTVPAFQAKPVQPLACAFANSNLTLVLELSLSIAPRMELITPALATVAEFRAARNDVVYAGGESRFGRNEQTKLANLFDLSHAAK